MTLRILCLHISITGWGTPQARCDNCGATFDWSGRDLVKEARGLIEKHRSAPGNNPVNARSLPGESPPRTGAEP